MLYFDGICIIFTEVAIFLMELATFFSYISEKRKKQIDLFISNIIQFKSIKLHVLIRLSPLTPRIVTDCKGILDGLRAGADKIKNPKLALARTWRLIAFILEEDFEEAANLLTWMPAHTDVSSIGRVLDSNGAKITPVMWRANRLVDAYAKIAARPRRLQADVFKKLKAYSQLV